MSFFSATRFLFTLLVLFAGIILNTHALPLVGRQDGASFQATTVSTTDQLTTGIGAMTKECQVTLEPIPDSDKVLAISKCKVSANEAQNNGSQQDPSSSSESATTAPEATTSSDTAAAVSTTSSDTAAAATTTSNAEPTSETITSASDTTTSVAAATSPATEAPAANPAISANGVSSVPIEALSSLATGASSPSPAPTSVAGAVSGSASTAVTAASSAASSTSAESSGSAAAAEQASSSASATAAAFEMPGKKLSVLPIGLGVFAGISVIALIVVGLVTYERTKYRRAFRKHKLAESGAGMGYGGMAQRT